MAKVDKQYSQQSITDWILAHGTCLILIPCSTSRYPNQNKALQWVEIDK